ncbi:MAG: adenosine kinase [Rhodospirillaceae bacterium]|jgi:sugar/nucleoside kinase (ribokinase family)|nr:adenosine kinase [Rhodospirillaceae bacterium]MBT4672021.1 adenosine kinase [Rhodospirillaceae bacterium]MBT4747847.1 adenosine kinase [Rhodospirillaceae bacterium]MBT5179476.1 adenosine kinase [Rhodospirillaceae bacterium]MBT5841752.1 adenosine kinase [Rhodospirillaceae bacterium]
MAETQYDVTGIGNAIVDVLTQADDAFIADHGLEKGAMTLIDTETAEKIYGDMGSAVEVSGGSAANTIAGLANLGARSAYIGKVAKDQLGEVFAHDIRAAGVNFDTPPLEGDATTARSMILVTPDAERTMQTYLGACVELGPEDVPDELIAASEVVYLEGYLYDPPRAKEAFLKAAKVAEAAGRKVALSLSDPFCVERYRAEFLELLEGHVNILFANEDEITSLYQVENFDDALQHVRGHCDIAALTRSANGSVVVAGDEVHVVDAETVTNVVDTTGAGDSYAAGFLYGLSRGDDLATAARIGGILAAEIISHYGARSESNLKELVAQKLG